MIDHKKVIQLKLSSSIIRTSFLDIKPTPPPPPKLSSKRIKREIHRSNTCPNLNNNDESKSGQRKSKRLRKSNISPPPPLSLSPEHSPEIIPVKKELINTMKRLVPSTTTKDLNNPNQIIVKTDKRYYWCTKCSKIYQNLISLYTESHYRQCVGEDQHFNVIHDPSFFTSNDILQQLPSNMNNDLSNSDSNEFLSNNSTRKKETIFFSKTTDDSRTYFINGKSIRMSTINRPITVKDLRQQFQQQSTFTINNPSEEYIFQQRQSPSKSVINRSSHSNEWTNESIVKVIPTPRSFDTFGISSDEDEQEDEEDKKLNIKQDKPEIEKTLIKRRYDSDNSITTSGQDDSESQKESKPFLSRNSQPISTERVMIISNEL
jgi:hypothetical protein